MPGFGSVISHPDGSSSNGTDTTGDIFDNIAPEQIVLIAGIIAIVLASDLSNADALSLAFFLSTVGSDIGLYVDRRNRETTVIPGVP